MDNTKFGSRPYDGKSRLSCQLKFFGAKKQNFISVYAKKPRILVKVNVNGRYDSNGLLCFGLRGEQSPRQQLYPGLLAAPQAQELPLRYNTTKGNCILSGLGLYL